jgi:short-subunit dehydrogenase
MRKAMVTGASAGIGRELARGLAQRGYTIVGVARSEERLQSLVDELGPEHGYRIADLATPEGQRRIADELQSEHFDLLVNDAGVGAVGPFDAVPVERTLRMMHLNCDAVVALAHAFLRNSRSGDALINVSSGLAFLPMAGLGVYSATKAFVTSFSESLWYEQKERGVYVMGLCPGITSTDFQVNAGGRNEDRPKNLVQTPAEVVEVALKALEDRRTPTVATNMRNAFFSAFVRAMPRKTAATMVGGFMDKMSQSARH